MASTWRAEHEASSHQSSKAATKNAITRLVQRDAEARASSSSFSRRVFVTDCCWVPTTAGVSTFVLCGLSNGCGTLLNVNSLSKLYLFADAARTEDDGGNTRRSPSHEQLSMHCGPFAMSNKDGAAAPSGKAMLCLTRGGAVEWCVLDTSSVEALRALQKSVPTRLLEFPAAKERFAVVDTLVRFAPGGARAFALLSHERQPADVADTARPRYYTVSLLRSSSSADGSPVMEVESAWKELTPPAALPSSDPYVRHFGWWGETDMMCIWSTGAVQLYRVVGSDLVLAGEATLFGTTPGSCSVRLAVATEALARHGAADLAGARHNGLISVVTGPSSVTTFNVHVEDCVGRPAKMARREDGAPAAAEVVIRLRPTQQSFFSEDIAVRSVSLVHAFSWAVVVVLESGAVVFLDAQTMELLVHRPLKRLVSDDEGEAVALREDQSMANEAVQARKTLQCFTTSRPLNVAVVEHNTIVLLKPQ